jgi:flagellar motor switch/type III secretory pathway protein FliN
VTIVDYLVVGSGLTGATIARLLADAGRDVLVLDRRVGDPVSLRVQGKLVGHGELVEVDGQIGIRLLQLTERAP